MRLYDQSGARWKTWSAPARLTIETDPPGASVELSLPSGLRIIGPEDVELVQVSRAGWGSASDGSVTVALDLEPNEELRREGLVRELIRHVQDLRKSSGLAVADRIVLSVDADAEVRRAGLEHLAHLSAEVLAVDVGWGEALPDATSGSATIDRHAITISLTKKEGT